MTEARRTRLGVVVLLAMLVLAVALLAGCGKSDKTSDTTKKSGETAIGWLDTAESALSTMAPDAKLLLVQTAQAATPTSTPVWVYLFGSPKTDKTYAVYVAAGKSMGAQQYGDAGLSDDEWAKVPGIDDWKIDSDVAYEKAYKASGAKSDPAAYMMGLITYKPKTDTSTIEAFTWSVKFDPGKSGATDKAISVDAKTGEATVDK